MIKEARLETGEFVAGAAVLFEPEGKPKKLRVMFPLGMLVQQGTRIIVDEGNPMNRPYVMCLRNGCISDYDADPDLVGKLKGGHSLTVQAINALGQPVSLSLALTDFAQAYRGPPTGLKVLEEHRNKQNEELRKKAEVARKKQQSSAASAQSH